MHLNPLSPGEAGRLIQTDNDAELFRALFLMLREWYPHRLFVHIESSTDEPLMAKAVITPDEGAWWQTDDAATIIAVLMDELHDQGPPGHYFGALDGSPNDYGYWPTPPEFAYCPNPRWRHVGMTPKVRYAVGHWEHLFTSGKAECIVVLGLHDKELIHAEVKTHDGYEPANKEAFADLKESVEEVNAEVFINPEGWGLHLCDNYGDMLNVVAGRPATHPTPEKE